MSVLPAAAQGPAAEPQAGTGALAGTVQLETTGEPLHKARVLVVQLGRTVETEEDGSYRIDGIPPGSYTVVVRMTALTDQRQTVEIAEGVVARADFRLRLSPVREQITVTASGREQTGFETFQSVNSLDTLTLTERAATSLGEVLDGSSGVAKRSFGPGSSRPVIRGFDGDRVLVLKDGVRTGSLSSQSGDHGESLDVLSLDRLEVVKGPATLLYGSNAIGGVVNAVSPQEHLFEHVEEGLSGYLTALGGTANRHGGGGAGFEYGRGVWAVWGAGSGQRTGDYDTPLGRIPNSKTRIANGSLGFGRFAERGFFSLNYGYEDSRYGIPFAAQFHEHEEEEEGAGFFRGRAARLAQQAENGEEHEEETVDVAMRRHNVRFVTGYRGADRAIEGLRVTLDYVNYQHKELEIHEGVEEVGTVFDNKQFVYRAVFNQRRAGRLSGSFGVWGLYRDYETVGAEALSPPVMQNAFAAFLLEEVALDRGVRLQFGGRVEHNRYSVAEAMLPDRSFTGFSGAAGVHVPLWEGGAFVSNYTHAHRAPALEELYNFGPHVGNLTFEIGNPALRGERSNGLDFSVRHRNGRVRAEANFFTYWVDNFVFLAPTGEIEDGLIEAEYLQGSSRFRGGEISLDVRLHPSVWLLTGMDIVNAQLTGAVTSPETGVTTPAGTHVPRIPPLRGRVGVDVRAGGFSLRPELVLAAAQEDLFPTETRTGGYTLVNLHASYTIPQRHALHVFSVTGYNLGDRLYRNHLSFIKDLAPEIGRGARFVYTVRFF